MKAFVLSAVFAVTFIILAPTGVSANWASSSKNLNAGYCPVTRTYIIDVSRCLYNIDGTLKRGQRAPRKRR